MKNYPKSVVVAIAIILGLVETNLYAQALTVTGKVVATDSVAIGFANVGLFNQDESEVLSGDISGPDGTFIVDVPQIGKYKIVISFIGYENWSKELNIDQSIQLETIILKELTNDLNEVVVKAKRPTIINKIDRLQFKIENTILSQNNLWEVLNKTPGIVTTSRGDIQMYGKSNVLVTIDDRPVRIPQEELRNMLEGMSANNVESIEVIDTPPSKYEAEGGGVLNIKLKKKKDLGYAGSIFSNYKRGVYNQFNNGLSYYYQGTKGNIYFNYNYRTGKERALKDRVISYFNGGDSLSAIWSEMAKLITDRDGHNYRFSSSYSLNKRATIGFITDGNIPKYNSDNFTETGVANSENIIDSVVITSGATESDNLNQSFNLNFEQKLSRGRKINADVDYVYYKSAIDQLVKTDVSKNNTPINIDEFDANSDQKINIASAKIDFTQVNGKTKMEFGAKSSLIDSDSDLKYYNLFNGIVEFDPTRSNEFSYKENTQALYFSYAKNFKKVDFKAGLRGEYTRTEGISTTLGQKDKNDYFKLFPTVYLQFRLNEKNILRFSYGRRISRPRFSLLNPFRFFYSTYSYVEGNPFLQPSFTDNFSLLYSVKSKYFFRLYFNYTDDPFTQISIQDNSEQVFKYVAINLDNNISTGLAFNTSIDLFKWWQITFQSNTYYKRNSFVTVDGEAVKNTNWNLDVFVNSIFDIIPNDLSIEIVSKWLSPKIQGAFYIDTRSDISLGVRKELFKRKATLSVYVADIFNTSDFDLTTRYLNQDHTFFDNRDNRYVRVSLAYKFGSRRMGRQKNRKSKEEKNKADKERLE